MDFLNIKEQIKKKGYTYEGFGIEVAGPSGEQYQCCLSLTASPCSLAAALQSPCGP